MEKHRKKGENTSKEGKTWKKIGKQKKHRKTGENIGKHRTTEEKVGKQGKTYGNRVKHRKTWKNR